MKIGRYEPKVDLIAYLHNERLTPEDLVVFGAHATTKKEDLLTLFNKALKEGKLENYRKRILKVTLESGHLSVLDQAVFSFSIRNLPRLSTLFLVQPLYLSHLQQSMRIVEPYGLYLPTEIEKRKDIVETLENAIHLYYNMVDNEIPKEDARYVIPLYTVTNIQTLGDARELTYLKLISEGEWIPTVIKRIVGEIIREAEMKAPDLFKKWGENYNLIRYYPAPNLFRHPNDKIDIHIMEIREKCLGSRTRLYSHSINYKLVEEDIRSIFIERNYEILQLLRNNSYNIITKMSIAALHQALRQRTWNHITETLYHALERMEYVIPPSITKSRFKEKYLEMVKKLHKTYIQLINEGVHLKDAVGVVSHSHVVNDIIKIDGWNVLSSLPIRRCLKAQWEIRYIAGEIASEIKKIDPILAKYSLPQCITLGRCPEKYPCEYVDHFLKVGPYIK